jgi:tricorn protease-like protein
MLGTSFVVIAESSTCITRTGCLETRSFDIGSNNLRRNFIGVVAVLAVTVFGVAGSAVASAPLGTTRISVDSGGTQVTGPSNSTAISADARFIAYSSQAPDLVTGDTNNVEDVFLYDTTTAETTRISVDSGGTQANDASYSPAISADGRYITYLSDATNLVANDTNAATDVFLYDTTTSVTTRISVDSIGTQANNKSDSPEISADGRYITYPSLASNLVTGDTNAATDVFLLDTTTAATTRISVDSGGIQANDESYSARISADGHYVTYSSKATNLIANDTNGYGDVFLYDLATAATARISVDSAGTQANAESYNSRISADGRYITYSSNATNLVTGDTNGYGDVFLYDSTTAATTRINVGNGGTQANGTSFSPAISADGRYIAYYSYATNLVAGDTNGAADIFLYGTTTAATTRISVDGAGAQANGDSYDPAISADGRYITYLSNASNLVAGDTNDFTDVFVYQLPAPLALASTGVNPTVPLGISILLVLVGLGVVAVGFYRRRQAA